MAKKRRKSKTIKFELTREVGALLFILAGIMVIAFPSLLAWIVGLVLIFKGLLEIL